ncbi:GATA transcription factor 9 isoform X2 [Hevea brasiliensis]|uniref:GATA transcription factor 9 isoform X2 n=1 Tax=Hevea brasiliensis TaxID=3981 RepID=UPI0025CFBA02|nr:GATA transcription factor 9 isoform X2 [Hevea brasiliensis]
MANVYDHALDDPIEDLECQLCIPQDPIEDLEWFPSFSTDLISLSDLCFTLEHEPLSLFDDFRAYTESPADFPVTPEQTIEKVEENKSTTIIANKKRLRSLEPFTFTGFTHKKQRSNRVLKQRKRDAWDFESEKASSAMGDDLFRKVERRCSHCETDKTPQWRLGPSGPKTLCNACGVRFWPARQIKQRGESLVGHTKREKEMPDKKI